MTAMATETVRNPSEYLTEGMRVVVTHIPSGESRTTTVTTVWPGEDFGVRFADRHPRAEGRLLHNGDVRSGVWLFTPIPTPAERPALTVGQRVRIASPAYTGNGTGYVAPAMYGQTGRIERWNQGADNPLVTADNGTSQYINPMYLTPLEAEAAPVATQHGFRVGQRLRHRYQGMATVIPHPPEHDQAARNAERYVCVSLDDQSAGGYYGGNRWVYTPDDFTATDEPDVPQTGTTEMAVGSRVRVTAGAWIGQSGVVVRLSEQYATVRLDRGTETRKLRSRLEVIGGAATETATAVMPFDHFVTGIRVRIKDRADIDRTGVHHHGVDQHVGKVGLIVRHDAPPTYERPNYNRRVIYIRFDDGSSESFATYASNVVPDGSPAPEIPEQVNPLEVGLAVLVNNRRWTVSDKAEMNEGYRRSYAGREYVALVNGADYTAVTPWVTRTDNGITPIPDTSHLSAEEQLLRFQRLVHRIASYEAVRRDWCDEVNGALAPLGLPQHLSTVDRALGRELRRRPDQLLVLDGEIETSHRPDVPVVATDDDEDDEPEYESRTFDLQLVDLEYDTDAGYRVSGAQVEVRVTVEPDEGYVPDPSEWDYRDEITDDMIRDAINAQGLPTPSRWASYECSDGDWTEV